MRERLSWRRRWTLLLAACGLLLVSAGMGGVTMAASAGDGSDEGKVIRLDERTTDFAYVANAPDGPLADYLVFHGDLFDPEGEKVGIDGGTCVFTSAAGESHCLATLSFAHGDITTQGLNTDPDIPFEVVFAVTGGTGEFTGAAGELRIQQVSEELAHLTLRLTRPKSKDKD